jgi:GDP-L-fucose synthase
MRNLEQRGFTNLITRTHAELDLTNQQAVEDFFSKEKPEFVILAAAKVGGIHANNTYPAEFIRDNLVIQTNVIHAAWKNNVTRLLFLGSSCIYPRDCPQPMKEEYLLTGPLEATNRPYAVAKIAGIEMCWSYNRQYGTQYLAVMPTNLFGPGDNFNLENSHVIPAIIRKMHDAKVASESGVTQSSALSTQHSVSIWGSGKPYREFLYSEDMADACVYLLSLPEDTYSSLITHDSSPLVNIGVGKDLTIRELAETIRDVVGANVELEFDASMPDGTPRKLLDTTRLTALGWIPKHNLREGLEKAYQWYLDNQDSFRA